MGNFGLFAVLLLLFVGAKCQECSGGPPMQPDNNCCNINYPAPQAECLQRVNEQRDAFRQSTNKDAFVKTGDMVIIECISNCLFNNTNVIAPDNKVNSVELKLVVEKVLGTEWQALLPSIIETCKDRVDNCNSHGLHGPPGSQVPPISVPPTSQGPSGSQLPPGSQGPPGSHRPPGLGKGPNPFMAGCDMRKEKLFFCLREQFLMSCPVSAWKNSADCNDMRSYVKNCPFERRGPPPPPPPRQQ